MCGIPMRRSKLSSAFKSLSLKRSASKSRLKLVTSPEEISSVPGSDGYTEGPPKKDHNDYEILSASKRASLRPCKSDNNLNEKQLYTEAEKEEPVYIEECKSYETFDPTYEPPPNLELQPCPICLRNSPSSTTSTSRLNQMSPNGGTANDKSASGNATKHTPHNSNFRRAYSLRMPRKVSRPMYVEKAKSNIQKGITDDGPVSPNFLKSSEYDELPIKSTFNALQMAEPKPKLRDSSTVRKNLKLEIRDPNNPAGGEIPLSKTDSLAVFLKYENELALSEKDMKDKSNSLSKRTSSLSAELLVQ
uniref:Uncharacterized protein n=1 Tax=Anopheles melas TaxID=34690 RepID=A0A182TDL5_9DIPT